MKEIRHILGRKELGEGQRCGLRRAMNVRIHRGRKLRLPGREIALTHA